MLGPQAKGWGGGGGEEEEEDLDRIEDVLIRISRTSSTFAAIPTLLSLSLSFLNSP